MALRIPIFMLLVLVLISSGFEHASSDQQTNHTSLFSPSASPSPAPVPVPVPVASTKQFRNKSKKGGIYCLQKIPSLMKFLNYFNHFRANKRPKTLEEGHRETIRTRRFITSKSKGQLEQLRTMEGAPTPRIIDWPTTEVRGIAIQNPDAHGKLQINQYGGVSPYWILDLERSSRGGYNAALVYSCLEGQDGQPRENLFVLSRLRSLSRAVVDRFMETARRNGIYTDCENPFVHTLQREGVCGWPYP